MQESATGISWYHRRDYAALLTVFVDGASFPRTYDEWLAKAIELEKDVRRRGSRVVRAYVDPIEFPKWCRITGHKMDASGRVAYGSSVCAEKISSEYAASTKRTGEFAIPQEVAAKGKDILFNDE
jgi:hypothetical protein